MTALRYNGLDRRGVARGGRTTSMTSAELAANLHAHGWKSATITDNKGVESGGVRRNDEGRRVWWGHR